MVGRVERRVRRVAWAGMADWVGWRVERVGRRVGWADWVRWAGWLGAVLTNALASAVETGPEMNTFANTEAHERAQSYTVRHNVVYTREETYV